MNPPPGPVEAGPPRHPIDTTAPAGPVLAVAVETPRHSAVGGLLDYRAAAPLPAGTLLRVPLGRRDVPGIVWESVAPEQALPPCV